MTTYIVVSVVSGILFGILDGLINANPYAVRLYEVYKPIAKKSVTMAAGMVIDLAYGFFLAGIFLLLYVSLPGGDGISKAASFAILVWFLRVAMNVAGTWMMFLVPVRTLLYTLVTGLGEMFALALLYGFTLQPA